MHENVTRTYACTVVRDTASRHAHRRQCAEAFSVWCVVRAFVHARCVRACYGRVAHGTRCYLSVRRDVCRQYAHRLRGRGCEGAVARARMQGRGCEVARLGLVDANARTLPDGKRVTPRSSDLAARTRVGRTTVRNRRNDASSVCR